MAAGVLLLVDVLGVAVALLCALALVELLLAADC